jgi:hypothetical protein
VSLEKLWMGQMGRLEEKIATALLYWLHSFPLACLIFPVSGGRPDQGWKVKAGYYLPGWLNWPPNRLNQLPHRQSGWVSTIKKLP